MKDPNDTRNIGPRLGSPLWFYLAAVSLAGAAMVAVAAVALHAARAVAHQPLFWVIAAMIVAGEIWPIVTPGKSRPESPAASITVSFAALLFWGYPLAILIRTAGTVTAGAGQRTAFHRMVFNAAQESLSLGAAGLVLAAAGRDPRPDAAWSLSGHDLPVVLAAAAAYFAVNFCLVAGAIALHSRTPMLAVVRESLPYQGLVHTVMLATAPLVAVAMSTGSGVMVALFALPLAALYLNAAMSVQREYQANHDELTGLSNRKLLIRRSTEVIAKGTLAGTKTGFLLLDLDGFKEINDTLGHAVGDRLLQIVAHRLTHSVRPGDLVARLGGDEFAVLLPAVKEASVAREVASRLRAALGEPVRLDAMSFDVQASVGIAICPDDAAGFEQLMQRADVAMYLAKERRSGIERYLAEADRNSADRLALGGDLRGAVHRGEVELHYQPKVRLADGQVIGMEALARWPHPSRGLLSAADFVGLAEQSQLISELTELVLEVALSQAARWRADGLGTQVCVNLPARALRAARFADQVDLALRRHGLPAEALRFDIAEQVLASTAAQGAATLRALVDLGVGVSLDDFGTGYSSLAQLTRLGISEVKLDPALVGGLVTGQDRDVTVRSLVGLAQSLGMSSVGEGVETEAVAAALRAVGCDGAQGWYFARPMNSAAATRWLADRLGGEQAPAGLAQVGKTAQKRRSAHRRATPAEPAEPGRLQIASGGGMVPGGELAGAAPGA